MQDAANGNREVTSNITGVSRGAEETGKASTNVLGAAGEMSRQSEYLNETVGKFLASIRAP